MNRIQSNVNIEFRKNKNNSSTRDRLSTLLATLLRADDTLSLLPLPEYASLPHLSNPTDVPIDETLLHQYLSPGKPTRLGTKHHFFLSSTRRIHQLKSNPNVSSYLRSSNTWLKYNTIGSTDITALGWMFRINPDAYSRNDLYTHMVEQLNHKFTAFQLNSRTITYNQDKTLTTRAWVIEMDKSDAKIWFPKFLETFPIGGDAPNLIPFSAANYNSDSSIKKVFYLHNQSLNDSALIRIDNLRGLTEKIQHSSGAQEPTLQQSFLDQRTRADPSVPLFFSVSQYNSGRITLLLKKAHLSEATELIDYFLDTYLPTLSPDTLKRITFPARPPIRIGRPSLPDHIALVKRAIDTLPTELNLDDSSQLSNLTSPPSNAPPTATGPIQQ